MSATPVYTHEERAKTRDLLKRLEAMRIDVEQMARGRKPFDQRFLAGLTALTDTSDISGQVRALSDLHKARFDAHIDHLVQLAPDDLSAFAEVINPAEPPAHHHIVMSDLLQNVEAGDLDRFALSMPPGHAKDLCVETPVMRGDGSWTRLGSIVTGDMVITMHGRPREVLAVHEQGMRPVLKIVTASGRIVFAHPEHLFLTPQDWMKAEDLQPGYTLALPKAFDIKGENVTTRDEFAFAGYMVARAVVTGRAYSRLHRITTKFRCDDPAIVADMRSIADRMGFHYRQTKEESFGRNCVMLSFDDACRGWLEEMGLWHAKKDELRISEWVFRGSEDSISAFLGAIMSCDATMKPAPNAHTGTQRKLFFSIRENAGLAQDLTRLFLRVGVKSTATTAHHENYNYEPATFHKVEILTGADQARIAKRLRIIGSTRRFWDLPINVETFEAQDFHNDMIVSITPAGERQTRCLTVEEDHSFLADGLVVHNSTYASRYYPAWYLGRKDRRLYLQAGPLEGLRADGIRAQDEGHR
jgi:hypothetical protein